MKNIPTSRRAIEIKHRRRVRTIRLVFLFFILLLIILGALSYLSFNKRITINEIKVEGTNIIDKDEVISQVKSDLKGKYFYLYNKSNSFIYPQKLIYNNLINAFPRISELSITRQNANILDIKIKERLGSYLYCGDSIPEDPSLIGENCYFVNDDGYIFDKAPYFSGNVYFKYYMKINDENNPLGQNIFNAEFFHQLTIFINGIKNLNFKPVYLVLGDNNTFFLYLESSNVELNPTIIFKKDNDLTDILDNLEIAIKKDEFANEINSKYSILEYIDLRFKNKVLYKFK